MYSNFILDIFSARGRTLRLIGACLALCMISIWAVFAGIAYATYDTAWYDSYMFASDVSLLLEQSIARDIETYDLSLKGLSENAKNPEIMRLPPAIRDIALFDASANAPGMGAMRLVDKDGNVTASSARLPPGGFNLADRSFFTAERDGTATPELSISHPLSSKLTRESIIAFSRPRVSPTGTFDGIVSGTMRVSYLNALIASVRLPPGGSVSLMYRDGTILARAPAETLKVTQGRKPPAFTDPIGQEQTKPLIYKSVIDGVERFGAYHRIGAHPIYVMVGLSTRQFLGTWRFRLEIVGLGFLLLSVIIFFLGVMLARELNRRTAAERTLSELATTDSLTELANRRRFEDVLSTRWRGAVRESSALSLLMIDCDGFKAFNDIYGHIEGDRALRLVADTFKDVVRRPGDLVARFGGEEFVVLLSNTDRQGAQKVAEAILLAIRDLAIPHRGHPLGILTVSIGVASRQPRHGDGVALFVEAADAALYVAKAEGRDRIVLETCADDHSARAA